MRHTARVAFAALALAACHSSTDVPATCDELKGVCPDGWSATLRTTVPGAYTIDVTFAGATTTLTCTLPGTTCTSSDARAHGAMDATGIELGTAHSPASVDVTVTRDGAIVLTKSFTPTYEPTHPNGDDCPPICAEAADQADIP